MKKIIATICAVAIFGTTAFADLYVSVSTDSNDVNVSGTSTLKNVLISTTVCDGTIDGLEAALETNVDITNYLKHYEQKIVSNGAFSTVVPFSENDERGKYEISDGKEVKTIYFAPLTYRQNLIEQFRVITSITDFESLLKENYMYLGIDTEIYEKCSSKKSIADMVYKAMNLSNAQLNDLVKQINRSSVTQCFIEGSVLSYKQLTSTVEFDNSYCYTVSEQLTEEGLIKAIESLKNGSYSSYEDFERQYLCQMAIFHIGYPVEKNNDKIAEYIISENAYMRLNLTEYTALSAQRKAEVAKKLNSAKPTTLTQLQTLLNSYVSAYNDTTPGLGGNGGGGRGSSKLSLPMTTVENNIANPNTKFVDMEGYKWSEPYVKSLTEMNIVSGYDDGTFRPGNNVTRAEFTKMLVVYLYSDYVGGNQFADVSEDMWAYMYIYTAATNSLITGSDGLFRPDDAISRQDAAVIIYRAALKKGVSAKIANELFLDDVKITDYAKDAVYALKEWGVISGSDTGIFNPQKNATRAETAKMLCEFINIQWEDK